MVIQIMIKGGYIMKINGSLDDLRESLVYDILAVIAQVFLLFATSWNVVIIILCGILNVFLVATEIIDWLYLSRKIILDAQGCTFVSSRATKTFTWEEINIQYTKNSSYLFGDSEIPNEGVILSAKPISKPARIGAMTYCRFTHPCVSVFIRFASPLDELKRTAGKFVYMGFVADKEEILSFLREGQRNDQ